MSEKPKVFSYLRFSSPAQATGTSVARQTEYATRWAAEHNLTLDSNLSLRDEGLSAYHQKHVKTGALGLFLRAVEDGKVPPGSVLIVEGLDRLSRAEPILAQGQLSSIIGAGIRVVTAADGREYSREILKKEPMGLVYSLLTMIRAHEESDTKSKRVKAAMVARCKQWLAGTYRGPVGARQTDPAWITHAPDGFTLHPERAAAVRTMIDLFMQGYGAVRIMEILIARDLAFSETRNNNPDRVHQIIAMRALVGEKTIEVDGESYCLPAYYPPLLTEHEFSALQHIASQRGRRPGKGVIPALFTGLGIAFCGYCGAPLVSQNGLNKKWRDDGRPQDGHRRIVCTGYKREPKCAVGGSCSVVPIERAVMAFCSDQLNLNRLVANDDASSECAARLAQARVASAATAKQISRLMDAMLSDPDAMPAAFAQKIRELEEQHAEELRAIDQLTHELAVTSAATPAVAQAWRDLISGVDSLDPAARLKARQLVADTFAKITVYRLDFAPCESDGNTIGLQLTSRAGNTRILRIDNITGGWRSAVDFDQSLGVPLPPRLANESA